MYTKHCRICGKDIGFYGWGKHVAKEKRLHGEDCYLLHKDIAFYENDSKNVKDVETLDKYLKGDKE